MATACSGSSFNYGFGAHTDLGMDRGGGRQSSSTRKVTTLLLPGIGTVEDLQHAYDAGARIGARRHPLHRGRHLAASISSMRASSAWTRSAS